MSWAFTGQAADDVLNSAIKDQEFRYEESKKTRRFWIKEIGVSKSVTFVDGLKHPKGYDLPFRFMEHDVILFIGGKQQRRQFSCCGKDCILCAQGNRAYLAEASTIIDHTEFVGKDGKQHKDELRLLVAKITVQGILKKYRDKKKSLRGWKFDVSRATGQSATTGDQFILDEHTELDASIQPPDYFELLAPKSQEDMKKILAGLNPTSPVGYNDAVATADISTSEEDAPIRF
jgi:hypothetical protein